MRPAGERHQPLETAVGAAHACEATGEDAAVEIGAQLTFDEGRQTAPMFAPLAGAGEERLEPVAHDLVQDGLLRLAPSVAGERRGGVAGAAFPDVWSVPWGEHRGPHRKGQASRSGRDGGCSLLPAPEEAPPVTRSGSRSLPRWAG